MKVTKKMLCSTYNIIYLLCKKETNNRKSNLSKNGEEIIDSSFKSDINQSLVNCVSNIGGDKSKINLKKN